VRNDARDDMVKLVVPLRSRGWDYPWPPFSAENLWASTLGPTTLKIESVPFYTIGLNYADIVEANPMQDGRYEFSRLVSPSGCSTWRIRMVAKPDATPAFESLMTLFAALKCLTETDGATGVTAISAPAGADVGSIEAILRGCSEKKILEFEHG
jgi:hypothetical protein